MATGSRTSVAPLGVLAPQPYPASAPASSVVVPPSAAQLNPTKDCAQALRDLQRFLEDAPTRLTPDQTLVRHRLSTGETISCIRWKEQYYITSTDIIRALVFRFQAIGRPVRKLKKFEEGVFSDLRNLKSGVDASLEEPRSDFLELLYKNQCIRTQKKQRVFHWHAVRHDHLFHEALERDLKREARGAVPTTGHGHTLLPLVVPSHRSSAPLPPLASRSRRAELELLANPAEATTPLGHPPLDSPTTAPFSAPDVGRPFKTPLDHYQHIAINGSSVMLPKDTHSHHGHDEDDDDVLLELNAVNSELSQSQALPFNGIPTTWLVITPALGSMAGSQSELIAAGPTTSPAVNTASATVSPLSTTVPLPAWYCPIHGVAFQSGCLCCTMVCQSRTPSLQPAFGPESRQVHSPPPLASASASSRARFKCSTCGRGFTRSERLRKHQLTHQASVTATVLAPLQSPTMSHQPMGTAEALYNPLPSTPMSDFFHQFQSHSLYSPNGVDFVPAGAPMVGMNNTSPAQIPPSLAGTNSAAPVANNDLTYAWTASHMNLPSTSWFTPYYQTPILDNVEPMPDLIADEADPEPVPGSSSVQRV
ncbi:hypothetical protein H4R34_001112 [Dimargaris verticillata]|uniref:C2H2-type domain-containing protein n=1 Tax=Dimargaris verticillata TaxID=2761393 RepID=A0A9W8BBF3_9FUNG|nr:hypothetical protein H4R34_001112 [Dimargaris verticillata]